ncbi:RelA/SpoT domain-containing protein [Photobacterium nomapromontoriensis]|uniref:RelA/SpoT domain-containing protein n=1 Tax=Photobacterium nomapromontoriensis TaxID=2910237 RepID=UPI003D1173F6
MTLTKEVFLASNNIDIQALERSHLSWDELIAIGQHHKQRILELSETAEFFVKPIQRCENVHSVRWRVKNYQHLMEKLIRKTDPESSFFSDKYSNISIDNYDDIVTDLIGVRAIHLFKDDFLPIDKFLRSNWPTQKPTIVYTRSGDDTDIYRDLIDDYEIKNHHYGYRSIHYVLNTKPASRTIHVEVQVRTIFEEGWSEIDHKVKYPNFSDNELVSYFLSVFNRLAGSADEMGSFVKNLVAKLDSYDEELAQISAENEKYMSRIDELLVELEQSHEKDKDTSSTITSLKHEISKLKQKSLHSRTSSKHYTARSNAILPDGSLKQNADLVHDKDIALNNQSSVSIIKTSKSIHKPNTK